MSITAATALQHRASNPAQHVWVSASAGSGKTTVLVSRLLRLLIGDGLPAPASPHRILCLTYTKAAAQEMQLRLEARLINWATTEAKNLDLDLQNLTGQQPDEAMRQRARSLFAELSDTSAALRIQTIHSFCQSVLARFPVEAGISPGFSALDEVEANALLGRALDAAWQQPGGGAWQKSKAWLEQRYKSAAQLQAIVPGLLRAWPEMAAMIPDEDGEEVYWRNSFTALGVPETENELWMELFLDEYLPLAALRSWAVKNKKDGETIYNFIAADIDARIKAKEFYWDLFFTQKDESRKALPEDLADEPARLLKIKDQRLATASAAIGILLGRAGREYQRLKDFQGALDFSDMINRTRTLLTQPDMGAWVHYKLDGGIDHILLDEAQDTAPGQWQVIYALAEEFFIGFGAIERPRSLFIVGDPKQSIYSFQGADSSLFRAMELNLSARAAAAETMLAIVPLSYSFRTAPNLLAWVDASFATAQKTIALHSHAEAIRHRAIHENRIGAARIYPPIPEIRHQKDKGLLGENNDTENTHNARLAAQIAETVAGWLRSGRKIASQIDVIEPRDILILLQQRTTLADALQSALSAARVPVMGSDRLRLVDASAVQDIFALCKFLLLPQDDLNLAIALRSPFINLSEAQLENLTAARGEQSLWQALNADSGYGEISDYLKSLLTNTDRDTVYETLARILFLPCPANAQSGLAALHARLGTQVDDPITELLQLAQHEGEANQPLSLGALIDWIKKSNIQVKREMAQQNQNVVRILTVHGAKGLEAPIVLLADASELPHAHGSKQDKAVKHAGDVPYFLFAPGKAEEGPAFDRTISACAKSDEHQRLLYVAMTRASHELHVFGKASAKGEVKADSWYAQVRMALEDLGALTNDDGSIHYGAADEFATPAITERTSRQPLLMAPLKPQALNIKPIAITQYVQQHARTTSYATNANPMAAERGTVIHRLLELLPGIDASRQADNAERFLQRALPLLTAAERLKIAQQVLQTIHDPLTQMFFGAHAAAEVPVAGYYQGTPLYGKIDRIFITDNDLGILDFKTGEPPKGDMIPPNYRQQIEIYGHLLTQIYPGRRLRSGILWTNGPKLLWQPQALQDAA